uniref:Mitochondrial GTPase 1 n=1 Tax=Arcella intermedia TaxID=1963864 RepID=A0A6B2LDU0_9EUKA|eukprot:TRINITY_DN26166_c0_g1_i1.p1 TRINITY_DN26166_c0_g1~~TRINITY_DN26166_c0_g1_i1.p1  ORF type:complete len:269 (+),score=84.91 TRINITY_DN26166_c0_g1_i1:245-1051(+)
MAKATRVMSETLTKIDTIIELRDGRLPISSANPELQNIGKGRRRVIIFTKLDLCNKHKTQKHIQHIQNTSKTSVLTADARRVDDNLRKQLSKTCKTNNETLKQVWLICGMPNVGKSTFINSLIGQGRKAPISASPGWTRGQTLYQLRKENALLLDTPGVMVPGVLEPEQGLKLALCGCIQDTAVPGGIQIIAEYLLFFLNETRDGPKRYRAMYDVPEDVEPIFLFQQLSVFIKKKQGKNDEESSARHFVGEFRKGKLGHFTLDAVPEI